MHQLLGLSFFFLVEKRRDLLNDFDCDCFSIDVRIEEQKPNIKYDDELELPLHKFSMEKKKEMTRARKMLR